MSNDEEIKNDIEKIWEKELKKEINDKIYSYLSEAYKDIDIQLKNFYNSLNDKLNSNQNINIIESQGLKSGINLNSIKNLPRLIVLSNSSNYNPLINPILQILGHCELLVNYFFNQDKNLEKTKNDNNILLSYYFLRILKHLWSDENNTKYNPINIHKILKIMMNRNYTSSDPGYIFKFILMKLNEELSFNDNQNNIRYSFFYNYTKMKKCNLCNNINNQSNEFSPLINIFIKIKDKESEIIEKFSQEIYNISLEDDFQKLLSFNYNDNEKCSYCNKITNKTEIRTINDIGDVLIIYINKNKNQLNKINIKYPIMIEYQKIVTKNKDKDKAMKKYELNAVLVMEENQNYAYIKNFIDKKWYLYSGENIQNACENDVFKKNASVLFYTKIK